MARTNDYGPQYYQRGNIPVWEFIRDQGLNFHLGNAVKYICRAGYKDSKTEDLAKAIHYLQNELENAVDPEPDAASESFSEEFPGQQRYWSSFTDDAEAFDR